MGEDAVIDLGKFADLARRESPGKNFELGNALVGYLEGYRRQIIVDNDCQFVIVVIVNVELVVTEYIRTDRENT